MDQNINTGKRKSVFRILLIRIFILVLLFNVVLASIIVYDTIVLERKKYEERKDNIKDEVLSANSFLRSSIETLQDMFHQTQMNATHTLQEAYLEQDLSTIDLEAQLLAMGLDSNYHDLYIIEDGVIINTTYPKDMGLDLYSFGEEHKQRLQDIIESGVFTQAPFDIETSTKRLRSYSYHATPDKKYIIEIGSYSEKADKMRAMFMDDIQKIVDKNPDILSINFWFYAHNPMCIFHEEYSSCIDSSFITHALVDKINTESSTSYKEMDVITEYLFAPTTEGQDAVVSIVTDVTDKDASIYMIIKKQVLYTIVFLVILLFVIYLATKGFKKVLTDLLSTMGDIAGGAFRKRVDVTGNNEFTTLAENFNQMVERLEISYNDLNQKNDEILAQRDEIEAQRDMVLKQKESIEEMHRHLSDSINYAERIQFSILPDSKHLEKQVDDHFVFFQPKDNVSGDFYWWTNIEGHTIITAADCTGHGVPGAFMSMLGISFLREIVTKEYMTHPGVILRKLRKEIIHTLKQKGHAMEQKDGMDMSLISIDHENGIVQFSGANNPIYLITKEKPEHVDRETVINETTLYEVKGDKMPIAYHIIMDKFQTHEIKINKGDIIYMFSDGFADQFGGPRGRKFKYKPFKEMLVSNSQKPMEEQRAIIDKTFNDWLGDQEQVDDVIVLGIRI